MAALSTAAWIAHNLGTAVGVGGSLFGQIALEPSARMISDPEERGMVVNDAWRTFGRVQLGALGVMAVTWYAGRLKLTGNEVDSCSRSMVVAKDVLVAATLASSIGAAVTGSKMAAQREDGAIPLTRDGTVSFDAPAEAQKLGRITDALGWVNLAAGIGVIAVTTMLSMAAGKSARWSVVSRFLP